MNEHKNKDSKLLTIMIEIKEEKIRYSLHERPCGGIWPCHRSVGIGFVTQEIIR